jgi:hypothetical protein
MQTAGIRRYDYRRRNWRLQAGCGCAIVAVFGCTLVIGALYMFGVLVPLIFQFMGVESVGDTDDLFADTTAAPTLVLTNPQAPQQVTVDLGSYGSESINTNPQNYTVESGTTDTGQTVVQASFTEAGLADICARRGESCTTGNGRYRTPRIDLRPGGAVIYAEVDAGLYWQQIGVVLRLDSTRTRFVVLGVDIDGTTYNPNSVPGFLPAELRSAITDAIDDIERVGNDVLQQVALETGGGSYQLSDIIIDDTTLTLIMR